MFRRTLAIMRKEGLHIIRDPRTLVVIFLIPIIQMVLMGYAATTDIDNIGLVVLDGDHSPQSRSLISAYEAGGYFQIAGYVEREEEMAAYLDTGQARAALVIPAATGQRILAGEPVEVGVIVDGSDPTVANGVLAAAVQTGQAWVQTLGSGRLARGGLEVRPTVWYNPGLESVNYMIPALMGLIMQFLSTLVTAMAIVREREYGTIEQLVVTPIKPVELVVGKTFPYILVSFFGLMEVLLVSIFWFGVPVHGSIALLLELSALFLLGSLGIGIVISSVANSQQEAMLLSFLILVPSIFLSGFFFPLEAMPWALNTLSYLVPLRYMLVIIRGIVLKGVGMSVLHTEVIFLVIFCIATLGLASARFRKTL
jgi:ABC-2 type transport system permease protein